MISIFTSQIFRSWVAIFQPRPPMASLFRSLYGMPGLAPRMDVLSWGRRDFQIASRTGIRQGTLEIVIEEVLWSIRGSYQTIWSFPLTNVKWHSVTWPYTMTTPYWSDFVPNSTFNRNLSGFHRTFATGVACRQGTLTPPDTWSRPFGTCICSTCWDQSFSELVVILPDYALRISLGTFSILLHIAVDALIFVGYQFSWFSWRVRSTKSSAKRNSDFLYELWRKMLWPRSLNPTNLWFLFNPRK